MVVEFKIQTKKSSISNHMMILGFVFTYYAAWCLYTQLPVTEQFSMVICVQDVNDYLSHLVSQISWDWHSYNYTAYKEPNRLSFLCLYETQLFFSGSLEKTFTKDFCLHEDELGCKVFSRMQIDEIKNFEISASDVWCMTAWNYIGKATRSFHPS